MIRIIIEDIKRKENKKTIIPKKTEGVVARQPISIDPNQSTIEDESKIINKEVVKESKIEEYFRNLSKDKSKIKRLQNTPQVKIKKRVISRLTLILFVLIVFLGGIYWAGNVFQKANITITSKHQSIPFTNKQFLASGDQTSKTVDFEIMITSDTKNKNIILTETQDVSIKAQGSVTLYNEFSTTTQKISAGTFLADNEGKSYKTDNTVTIPGYKLVNKKIVPGQVIVKISAFLPGEAYNGAPSDFNVTAFKGTTKYNKIYGKLKSPLIGGASGLIYVMNDLDKNTVDTIAQTSFKEDMIKKVKALVPPGYILYPGAFTFSYTINDNVLFKTPEAPIEINGELSAILLKEESLVKNILNVSFPEIEKEELKEITIPDLSALSFNFLNKDQVINKETTSVQFLLNGNIDAIWKPNIEVLKAKLLGVHKDDVLSIFRQDPGIAGAMVRIFPPWRPYIPNNPEEINIILN